MGLMTGAPDSPINRSLNSDSHHKISGVGLGFPWEALRSLWGGFGIGLAGLEAVWGRVGVAVGSVWGRFGFGLGSVWNRFGVKKAQNKKKIKSYTKS